MQSSRSRSYSRRSSAAQVALTLAFAGLFATARSVVAQHQHGPPAESDSAQAGHAMHNMMIGPLGISHARMGSGTSWMPDSSPMHASHKMIGDWSAMLHGVAFGQYDYQGSNRGDKQLGILDWEMAMLMRQIGSGLLHLHGMVSLEPATIGAKGYPLLLQTGESYKGEPLHDRQHPHDFMMELAALFQQPIAKDLAVEFYGGPAGEPALGPVAFMHRPSAQSDPLSPLGHHWQDATHISYGVLTAGLYSRTWKVEGSWFNGREPDENRWTVDLRGLNSYSGRVTVNPTGRLSMSTWYGYLPSPEQLRPDEPVHRYGASLMYGGRGISGGSWASSLIWGANAHAGLTENSGVAETNFEIGEKNALFGRVEYVRKSAEDLVLPSFPPDRQFDTGSLLGGYVREVASIPGGSIGIGGLMTLNVIPRSLQPFYGTRTPMGFNVYVRVRPKRMATDTMSGMSMPVAHDSTKSPMPPGVKMPGMETHPPEREMPRMMMPDSARGRRDSTARMPDMRSMPSMSMPHDTMSANKRDSTKRDTTTQRAPDMPGMPGMKNMPAMSHDTVVKKPSRPPSKSNATKSRSAAKKPSSQVKTPAERPATKKPSATGKPKTAAPMPNMPGMKPGMKMPPDTPRTKKPDTARTKKP